MLGTRSMVFLLTFGKKATIDSGSFAGLRELKELMVIWLREWMVLWLTESWLMDVYVLWLKGTSYSSSLNSSSCSDSWGESSGAVGDDSCVLSILNFNASVAELQRRSSKILTLHGQPSPSRKDSFYWNQMSYVDMSMVRFMVIRDQLALNTSACWSVMTIDLALTCLRHLVSIGSDNSPSA